MSYTVLMIVFLMVLSGCTDIARWESRTFFGIDCSPQVAATNHGQCLMVRKGS